MGWDAYTEGSKDGFKEASNFVKEKTGSVDGMLEDGGLDCMDCGLFLQEATGESVFKPEGWPKNLVKELNANTKWDEIEDKEPLWAFWSARKFLETCAELELDIKFGV